MTVLTEAVETHFPHRVARHIAVGESRAAIYAWCRENCGGDALVRFGGGIGPILVEPVDAAGAWCHLRSHFWFRSETHACAFKLRWC